MDVGAQLVLDEIPVHFQSCNLKVLYSLAAGMNRVLFNARRFIALCSFNSHPCHASL